MIEACYTDPAVRDALVQNAVAQEKLRQVLAARARSQAIHADYTRLAQDPNPKAVSGFLTACPEMAKDFATGWSKLKPGQRETALQANADIYHYLKNGDPEAAIAALQACARAARASGGDIPGLPLLIGLMRRSPAHAHALAALNLAVGMEPEAFVAAYGDDGGDTGGGAGFGAGEAA